MGLHDDNFRINEVAFKQQIPPPTQLKVHVLNTQTEMDEATCSATSMEKSVSIMPIIPVRLRSAESEVLRYPMLDVAVPAPLFFKISYPAWV